MANSNGGIIGVDNPVLPGATAQVSTFNSTGTFTAQAGTTEVEYLVIAGAGGGGGSANGNYGGGGGAGGFRTATGLSVTGGSSIPVTVGAAGAGGPAANGESGKGSKGSNQFLVLSHQLAEAMAEAEVAHQMYLQVDLEVQVAVADALTIQIPTLEIHNQELETKVVFLQ